MWTTLLVMTALAAEVPNFTCRDSSGTTYKIWLTSQKKVMEIQGKAGNREISLTQKGYENDFSTEYAVNNGTTETKISLIVDNREKLGLSCQASKHQSTISEFALGDRVARYAKLLTTHASERLPDGKLDSKAIEAIVASVKRLYYSPANANRGLYATYIDSVSSSVNNIHPASIAEITKRMTPSLREFWNGILTGTKYKFYAEADRYKNWIREGANPSHRDLDSIRAGFNAFTKTAFYPEKNYVERFSEDVRGPLGSLSDTEAGTVEKGMDLDTKKLFSALWLKATNHHTLADYPEMRELASQIQSDVTSTDYDPQAIREKIAQFLSSSLASDKEARAYFISEVSGALKKLTPRQLEDLNAWLEGPEKDFVREIVTRKDH